MSEDAGFITDGLDAGSSQDPSTQSDPNATPDTTTAATPEGESQAGDSQTAEPKWKAQLPDDLKGSKELDQYDSIGALAKAVLDKSTDGSNAEIAVPGDDDAEAWGQLYDKLGRPSTPDEYELTDSKLPEDVEANLRTEAHQMGLSQKQFGQLAGILGKSVETQKTIDSATFKGTAKDCELQLRKEFGDEYEAKMNTMKRGADKLLTKDLRNALGLFGHLNNPDIAKAMIQYGEAIAEDVPEDGGTPQAAADETGWNYPK